MACKFRAFMNHSLIPLAAAFALALPAHAEKADRFKPITIQADSTGQLDLQKQVAVFSGNVVVTKGTMLIHAARIEVSKTPGGYDTAVAFGAPGRPATFRQKRDGVRHHRLAGWYRSLGAGRHFGQSGQRDARSHHHLHRYLHLRPRLQSR